MESSSSSNLRKRLYQNLLHKQPKQNHLLGSDAHTKSAILKPKVALQAMNTTAKITSPVFNKGKIMMETRLKSPQVPKKIAPIPVKQKISKQGKAIIEQGKLKSKANLKPHDIFAFYDAFPQMSQDFFYLNRASHPYDYQIVTYNQRNPMQYMTISLKGVTLYHQKEAQFLTKQEWLEDEKIYYSLQKIDFFKQYKISKNFTIWKNRMRRHYIKQMSNLLNENLFFSYEHPRHCLLDIRKATNHMKQTTYFMPLNSIESLEPSQFKKNAQDYIETHFVSKLKQVEDMMANHLQLAITEQIKKFKLQNNIKINDVGDYDQKEQKQGYVYSQQAILRKQYKKVNKLIKLADNILLQSKIELIQECLLQLIERIQDVNSSDSKSQWIKCTASLVENELENTKGKKVQWNPTLDGLKIIFKDIINLAVTKMSDLHEKISSREKFLKYRPGEENENRKDQKRSTLKYIIEESPFYTTLIKKINNYLQQEFKKTEKHEQQLLKYIEIYAKHKSLPQIREIFKMHSASQYIQLVRQWREDDNEMHLLPMNKNGGMLIFDYSLLRSAIHDTPKKTLASFLGQLPEETRKKYNQLVVQSEKHLELINNYPINMEEFVEFNQAVKNASSALDDLIEGSKSLIQMVALIDQNKTPGSDFNKINPKKATENITKLKAKVDESNAKYDQSLSKFKKQLQSRVSSIKTAVKSLSSKFQVIPFDQLSSQITPTLQKLHQIFPSIQKLEQQAKAIQQIEWQLSLPQSQLDEIHSLYQKSIDVKNLWEQKQKWNQMILDIYNKHYKQIDCKMLKNKWEEFSKTNTDLLKTIPDNEVLKKLVSEVTEFQNLIETIASLTSPNLQEKSWRQISQYLAYELNIQDQRYLPFSNRDDPEYTVEWLINKNISLYKQKICFIVQKSQKEKELQTSLTEFKAFISSIVFQTTTKKREVILVQKNQHLEKNIKDKLSILYSLIRNQYSEALKNEAETLIKHFEYLEEILSALYTFKDQWQKYDVFFDNNPVFTKMLTKEAKQFSSWELQWKKIIKNITNDPSYFYRKICDETTGVNCSRAILKSMTKANMFLELVRKGFEEFLEKKRLQFPRYNLFTDQELLSILSKFDGRHLVIPQIIPILYDNFKSIQYDEESGAVLSVTTYEGQKFPLLKQTAFKMQSQMEDLLKITQDQIKKTMAQTIRSVFSKYIEEEISRESLITDNHVQVILQVDYIAWVRLAEETYLINQPVGTIQDWLNIQEQQIKEISQLMKNSPIKYNFKFIQLMVQSIYFRQKTLNLKSENITDTSFYQWQRIPKMIMTNNDIHLRQLDSKIPYNYELLNQKDIVVIQSETEKVWLNLINAITSKEGKNMIGLRGNDVQSVRDLAFYVGQTLRSINLSQNCNIKTVEKFLTGCMHVGFWIHFAPIENTQILSYLSYHINSTKKLHNLESTSSTLQLTKTTMLNSSFSNSIFLFEARQRFIEKNLIDPKNFRNITLHRPNQKHIISILCQAQQIPKSIGMAILSICDFCRETFEFSQTITQQFLRNILKQIKEEYLHKLSHAEKKDPQFLDFIVLTIIEDRISHNFSTADSELFQSFKTSFLPNYQLLKNRFGKKFARNSPNENHPVNIFLNCHTEKKHYSKQFINQAIKVYNMLTNDKKLGVILSGPTLSGKSQIIKFIEQVHRFYMKVSLQEFEMIKIYPKAYNSSDLIKSYWQEKKERKRKSQKFDRNQKDKSQKINEDLGMLQHLLNKQVSQKWIILDGQIDKSIFEFVAEKYDDILVPNYGVISKDKNHKQNLQKVKIIIETLKCNDLQPSSFYNYSLCNISQSINDVQFLVNSFFQNEKIRKCLRFLTDDSISYMQHQFIVNLTKVQHKGNIKSKSLQFLYPFAEIQITHKCLKLVQSIFKLNQESIRQKQKNMKKTIEKFVFWAILIVLYLHVEIGSQSKLQKKFVEICKCENIFNESIINYIVYPGSGIEVHPVNGLRTQSSLFEIPEKGIITLTTKNDFNDFNNFINQNGNKFYEQINLETISSIRINHHDSNMFNYYAQLFAYSNCPIVLTGPVGTGKKGIFQLYAKNVRHRAFVHSFRLHSNKSILDVFEKPFRKYESFEGTVLKSPSVTKDVFILIDDLNLVEEQKETLEFFRMLLNDNAILNRIGKTRRIPEDHSNISILSNRIDSDENVIRLGARMMFFQTGNNSSQKLASIFSPYLKAWAKANELKGQLDRIFSSANGDTLLDATIKIFEWMQQTFKSKKSQQDYSINTIVLKPRIGDITKVLSSICMTQDANKKPLNYYSQLWANEIMRVFEDRLSPSQTQISKNLMELVKKEFFLKFKENFQYNPKQLFIFSSYLSGQNRLYERIYDLEQLQQMIQNAYESRTITVPVKLFFSQLLKQILKIYRILQITNGHMILFHINKRVRQYLIQLASQVAQTPFLQLKQSILTPQRDIISILQYQSDVTIFQDIDDITQQQIYQFTCLLNKNDYDFDIQPESREKIKSKVTKYLRQIVSQISSIRESTNQSKKLKIENMKQKQTAYINQKLQDDLQNTMQQILMNNVHFLFGASPMNEKTKRFLLNQTDLVGQMHYSFFDITEESLMQISKQVLMLQDVPDEMNESQKVTRTIQETKRLEKQADAILSKCNKIYLSLPYSQKDYNSLLSVCENIMSDRQKLKQQTQTHIDQLQRTIQNYQKADRLIIQNQIKLQTLLNQLEEIKQQQSQLSQKLEDKGNQINQLRLNFNQTQDTTHEDAQKKQLLSQKTQQFQTIQNDLRQIKMKKDKNDILSRQARKMIQLSKDYHQIVKDISEVEQKLSKQKSLHNNVENILCLWWSLIIYSSNKDTQTILAQLNEWMDIIQLKEENIIKSAEDVLKFFELIISPLSMAIPALGSLRTQNQLKVIILMFIILRHNQTNCENRMVRLYDPCKVYTSVFRFFLMQSQLGNFSLAHTIHKYDDDFWTEIQKYRKGIIFLDESIESRQKKEIQSHITKRHLFPINRFISLVDRREKADVTFIFEKNFFINYLKLQSMLTDDTTSAMELMQIRQDYIKETRRLKQMKKQMRTKIADIKFEMQTDTEQLSRFQRDINLLENKIAQHHSKVNLLQLKVTEQKVIRKVIDQLYKYINLNESQNTDFSSYFDLHTIERLYRIVRDKVQRLVSELRQKAETVSKKMLLEKPVPPQAERKSIRPSINSIEIPSQIIEQFSKSPFDMTIQEQSNIDTMIQTLMRINFSKDEKLKCQDMFDIDLLSLQLESKVPIVVIENNLSNQSCINRQNKPVNLLHNTLSNVILEASVVNLNEDKNETNKKILLFYNDSVHFNALQQLVDKYLEDYRSTDRKHIVYVFTNVQFPLLLEGEKSSEANYKIFYYQKSQKYRSASIDSIAELNQESSKARIFIKLIEKLSNCKYYNNILDVEKYCQYLHSKIPSNIKDSLIQAKDQLKQYLLDLGYGFTDEQGLVHKLVTKQLNIYQVNEVLDKMSLKNINLQPIQSSSRIHGYSLDNQIQSGLFQAKSQFSQKIFEEFNEQLPNIFNPSEFLVPATKDSFTVQIEKFTNKFNQKLKSIKTLLQRNLKTHTLAYNKLSDAYTRKGLYLLPTDSYILELNKEFKIIKKLLTQNGLLSAPVPSMSKIISNKGINANANVETHASMKNCLYLDKFYFNMRVFNEFKIRASKKLKIPLSRLGLLWIMERKTDNVNYSIAIQKLLSSLPPDIVLSMNAKLINSSLKNQPAILRREQKEQNEKVKNALTKNSDNLLRLLAIPYDSNSFTDTQNLFNITTNMFDQLNQTHKKKTIFGETILRREETMREKAICETIKIKLFLNPNNTNSSQSHPSQNQIGVIELPSNQIYAESPLILIPKIQIITQNY